MVKNHKLAKSISDAASSQFTQWLQYFGKVYGKAVIAVAPQYTSLLLLSLWKYCQEVAQRQDAYLWMWRGIRQRSQCRAEHFGIGLRQAGIALNTVGTPKLTRSDRTISTRWW